MYCKTYYETKIMIIRKYRKYLIIFSTTLFKTLYHFILYCSSSTFIKTLILTYSTSHSDITHLTVVSYHNREIPVNCYLFLGRNSKE